MHAVEHYAVSRGVVALTVLELVGFAVIYGCSNLYNDLEFVIGSKLSSVWRSLWLVTPCVLCVRPQFLLSVLGKFASFILNETCQLLLVSFPFFL